MLLGQQKRNRKRQRIIVEEKEKEEIDFWRRNLNCLKDVFHESNLLVQSKLNIFNEMNYFPVELNKLIINYDTPNPFQDRWEQTHKICEPEFIYIQENVSYYLNTICENILFRLNVIHSLKSNELQLKDPSQQLLIVELGEMVLHTIPNYSIKLKEFYNSLDNTLRTKHPDEAIFASWIEGKYEPFLRKVPKLYEEKVRKITKLLWENKILKETSPTSILLYFLSWRTLYCKNFFLNELGYQFNHTWGK
jgi:hypothetical protein